MQSDVYMGQIGIFAFSFAPVGWQTCAGQILSISQNNALFALLGTVYGGNGTSTFGLPDLQGRTIVGTGVGAGLQPVVLGEKAGVQQTTLLLSNMPVHNHNAVFTPTGGGGGTATSVVMKASTKTATDSTPTTTANVLAADSYVDPNTGAGNPVLGYVADSAPTISLGGITVTGGGGGGITGGTVTVGNNGGSLPVNIQNPFLGLTCCIALTGIFPTRN